MLRKYLVLGIMMGALALTGCGNDKTDTGNNSDSTKNNDNKEVILPVDTISSVKLQHSFEKEDTLDINVSHFLNNLIICDEKGLKVIDIYENYNNQIIESGGVAIESVDRYGSFILLEISINTTGEKGEDDFYIYAITPEGTVSYKDSLGKGSYPNPYIVNKDNNLVYQDNNNTIKCVNPLTGEEIYKIDSITWVSNDDFTDHFITIDRENQVKQVYNISNGELVLETTIKALKVSKHITRYTGHLYIVGNNIVLQEKDETGLDFIKHSVFDENGKLTFSTTNPEEIPIIEEIGWNNSVLCRFSYAPTPYTAICKTDLTNIVTLPDDADTLEIFDEDSIYLDEACESKISIYTNRYQTYGYIVTDTEAIEFTRIEPVSYSDWYIVFTDTTGKRYILNMANGVKIEIEPTDDIVHGSDIYQITETYSKQSDPVFFAEETDTVTKVFDHNGNLLFTTETEEYGPSFCASVDSKKVVLNSKTFIIIYDREAKKETRIEKSEELSGVVLTIVKDKYLLYYVTDKATNDNKTTLKQLDIETNEITELVTLDDYRMYASNDMIISTHWVSDTDTNQYQIYTYK